MARTNNLTNFLTDVADAIRTKTGGSSAISASKFDTEIENIPSGGGDIPEINTEVDMDNIQLDSSTYGNMYHYTGTEDKYLKGIYKVQRVFSNNGIVLNDSYYCTSSTSDTEQTVTIDCKIGSKLIAFISIRNSNYTISSGWNDLGISNLFSSGGFNQYMVVATKTANSGIESITVTQGSSARMYINLIEIPSNFEITFNGYQYNGDASNPAQYITIENQNGIKIYGLSSTLWATASISNPWVSDNENLIYYGKPMGDIQQRQGVFGGNITSTANITFTPGDTTETQIACAIFTLTSSNYTPENYYNYYLGVYGLDKEPAVPIKESDIAEVIQNFSVIDASSPISGYSINSRYPSLKWINCIDFQLNSSSNFFSQISDLRGISLVYSKNFSGGSNMFYGCTNLRSVKLALNNSTNFKYWFYGCTNLKTIDFSASHIEMAANIERIFSGCTNLKKIDFRNFSIELSTNYSDAFNFVPDNCEIIVSTATQKQWFATNFSRFTNVKTVAEYEAEQNA